MNRLTPADAFGLKKSRFVMIVGKNNASTREEWIKKALLKIPQGSRILDAGAGERQFESFCSHLNYVAQDFGKYDGSGDGVGLQMGKWDQSNLDITSDIADIPEEDNSFDAIMCTEVFEHLPNPVSALVEFSRLLRAGGHLIVTAPFCSLTHFAPFHYYSGFNRYFFVSHLDECKFDILELSSNGNYFEFLAQEIRRIKYVASKYAKNHPNLIERFSMLLVLRMLEKCSKKDKESDKLLCFGYHVLARKR